MTSPVNNMHKDYKQMEILFPKGGAMFHILESSIQVEQSGNIIASKWKYVMISF